MRRDALEKSWALTRAHLAHAASLLPATPVTGEEGATLCSYQEWLSHNELEFALDDLAELGLSNAVPAAFWQELIAAAENMQLRDHADRYRRILSARQA